MPDMSKQHQPSTKPLTSQNGKCGSLGKTIRPGIACARFSISFKRCPKSRFCYNTGCRWSSGREATTLLHRIAARIQWDHSRIPKQSKNINNHKKKWKSELSQQITLRHTTPLIKNFKIPGTAQYLTSTRLIKKRGFQEMQISAEITSNNVANDPK